MRYPAELYRPSPRPYRGLPELHYPLHERSLVVTRCGRLCFGRRKIHLSQAFAGQMVGVREVAERVECATNPFEAKVLPMSSE
jgi:putative transposase